MISKTQRKKIKKEKIRTLYQLAELHQKQADCHSILVQLYKLKAEKLKQ